MESPSFQFADAETRTRTLVHVLILVVGGFLGAIATASVGFVVFGSLGYQIGEFPPEISAVISALEFSGFILVGLWYVNWAGARDILYLRRPSLGDVGWTVVGLLGLIGLLVGLSVLLEYLGIAPARNVAMEAGREQPRLLVYLAVVSLLFTAPAEEFLYRGLVQGLFREAYGVVPAILAASAVFGVVHYLALVGTGSRLAYLLIAAVLGLVLGAVYERTENLVVPIAVHGLFNAYQFLSVYAIETGIV